MTRASSAHVDAATARVSGPTPMLAGAWAIVSRFLSFWSGIGGSGERASRSGAAMLVMLGALLGAVGDPARAEALVSNIDLTAGADLSLSDTVRFQEFTAGDEDATLGGIEIKFSSGSDKLDAPAATLRRWDGSSYVLVAELAGPGKLAAGDNEFAAPGDTALEAGVEYAVHLEGGGAGVALRGTADDSESGRDGWSIHDDSLRKESGASSYETSAAALMIRVNEAGPGDRYDPFEPPLAPSLSVSETTSTDGSWTVSWGGPNHDEFYYYVELEETSPGGTVSTTTFYDAPGSTSISGKTVAGAYKYRVKGCSNLCSDWSGSLTVTYAPNSQPVVGAISDLTVSRGSTGTRTATVTDGDTDDTHTVTATSSDEGVATVSVSGKTLAVRGVSRGTATITVTATDNSGESNDTSAPVPFEVRVSEPPNSRPVVLPIPGETVPAGENRTVTVTVEDADEDDTHTLTATSSNRAVATVSPDNRALTLTIAGAAVGTATITVTATDDSRESNDTSVPVTFEVRVSEPPNSRPVVLPIPDQTVPAGENRTVTVTVEDADEDDTHTLTATSSNRAVATVSPDNRALTLTIAGAAVGTATITVTATDDSRESNDTSVPVTFEVRVSEPANSRPVVLPIPDQTVPAGENRTVTVTVEDADEDDEHTLTASSSNRAVATVSPDNATLTLTLTGAAVGEATISVTATDDSGAPNAESAAVPFGVRVPPPVPNPLDVPPSNATGSYEVSWGNSAGATRYELQEKAGSGAWAPPQNTSATSKSFSDKAAGTYMYRVRACAGASNCSDWTAPETVLVSIEPEPANSRPVVSPIAEQTVTVGGSGTVDVMVTDADADDMHTLTATSSNRAVATVSPDNGALTLTITGAAVGDATISVTARDDSGAPNAESAAVPFGVRVPPPVPSPFDVPPSNATGSYEVSWGNSAGATRYELQEKAGSGAWAPPQNTSATSKSFSDKAAGTYMYRVRACAGASNCSDWTAPETVLVSIEPEPPNSRPVVLPIPDQTVPAGENRTVTVTVEDADADDEHTLTATSSNRAVATVSPDNGALTLTITGAAVGDATISVTARDDSGAPNAESAAVPFGVRVPPPVPSPFDVPPSNATGSYEVSWGNSAGATRYELQEKAGSGAWAPPQNTSATSKSFSDKAAGTYMYRVRACAGASNCSDWTAPETVLVSIEPEPPNSRPVVSPIAEQTVTVGGSGTVDVMVTDADADDMHTLTATSSNRAVATVSPDNGALTLTITGVAVGDATITVTARDDSDAANDTSVPVTFPVRVTEPPPPNDRPVVADIDDQKVKIRAEKTVTVTVTDEDDDEHTVRATSDDTSIATVSETGNPLTLTGVAAGIATIRVTATDDSGAPNAESAPVPFAAKVPPPVPGAIRGPDRSLGGTYTLKWGASVGATSYRLRERIGAGGWRVIQRGAARTRTSASQGAAIYAYQARACAGSGNCSDWTDTKTVAVPPRTPGDIEGPDTSDTGDYTLRWGWSPGATSYLLQEKVDDGRWEKAYDGEARIKAITDRADGTHRYRVKACAGKDNCSYPTPVKTVTVSIPNSRPVVSPIADRTVMVGAAHAIQVPVTVADADAGDLHAVAATSSDEAVATVEVSEDGTELTLTGVAAGEAMIEVVATDDSDADNAASEPETFAARVNTRPVVESIEAQSTEPGGEPVVVAVTVTDPDSGQEHEVIAESDDVAVTVEVSEDGAELTLTGVSAGEATIEVIATDDSGADNAVSEPVEFVVASNTAPTAEDDMALTGEYTAVEIDVLANDTDPDGQPLTVESSTNGAHGTTAISGNGITYMPDLGFRGIDIFGYTVTDGVDTAEASVWVWVDVLRASPNPSYTGSYTVSWAEPPRQDVLIELWETTGGASEQVYSGIGPSKAFSRRPEGTYTYHLRLCAADGECLAMPEPHLDVQVMFSPETPIRAANTTGNMPYETGVTKGGDAYIHMPLVPVPGVNGLQPRLSFDYSGGRDRQRLDKNLPGDILGYGWHVGGFSAIRWCLTNQTKTEIVFSEDGDLCLDGEPLVLAEGRHLYYGAVYRTLRDTYARIVLRRSDEPGVGWFEVRMPDGSVREYGRTPDSNLVHTDASGSRTFLWSVNRETDAFDNAMTYEYHEDEAALARHPKRIAYGDGGDAEILFEYAGRGDIATVMAGGLEQVQWLRVHSVDVRLNSSTVRKYLLESEVTTEGWVRLTKLQMCAYRAGAMGMTGAQECLPPFVLEWMDIAEADAVPVEKTCVSKLTDPLGVDTKFAYATLTEKGSHDFLIHAADAPFGAVVAPVNARALPATASDDIETGGRIKPIVTRVARTNGVGGEHVMKYAYLVEDDEDEPKPRGFESTLNWGFLGFYAIRETDAESGIVTYTQYRLDYPHFGKPARVSRYDGEYGASPETLWERHVTYAKKTIRHASRNRTDLPHVRFETELIYEGGTQLGATHTTYALEMTSDGYPETLERTTKAGHSVTPSDPPPNRASFWGNSRMFTVEGLQRRTITETVFHNRTGTHWLIGFADYVTVKQGTGSAERTIETDPTAYGDTNAVDTATRFPGDTNLEFTTNHDYDGYGNREETIVTAAHADRRTTSIGGFAAARYPTSITNAAEHVEQLEHDARLGLPTKATDANNRVARLKYDALGREVERIREWDDNATTTTSYDSCTMCDVTVAAGKCSFDGSRTVTPAMVSETISPMTRTMQGAMSREAPTTRRYFDKLGRVIRTEVEAFEGMYPRRVDAFYDARGRLACESAPHHSDETPHYTTYEYDVRDRVTVVVRPDGGSTSIDYEAVAASHRVKATATETVKDADGMGTEDRESERLYNILGELVEATDGSDKSSAEKVTTTYAYDTSGLLRTVTADGVATTFEYDAAGNRESVTNPDMGTAATGKSVRFAYTGLGQVRERTDGRGTTTYAYDLLGRPTSREDPAGTGTVTATWSYDPANGKGRLGSRSYGGAAFSETYEYNLDERAAGGGHDDDPGRRHDRDARREPRLRQPGPAVVDDVSVGAEGGARLQRAGLSRYADGRHDGDEEDAGQVRRDGRLRQHRDGDLRQRRGDVANVRPGDGQADGDRDGARDFDVPGPRLRVAHGRLAREPHRERGGERDVGAGAAEGGVRLRLPGAPRQRDEAGRVDDGEPDAGLRVRQSRQPDVEDERRGRRQERDVDHVRAEIGGTARADAGDGRWRGARLPLRRPGPPGAGRRGERRRPVRRVGRPGPGDEGDGGDGEGRGEPGGA